MLLRRRRPWAAAPGHAPGWRERGATVLEAAVVTPVFFMLIFGIIEAGLAMNDNLALSHSVRAGSRLASAAGADPYADYGIMQSMALESSAIPRAQIERIVVYRADRFGDPPSQGCRDGTPAPTSSTDPCNVYTAADFDRPREDFGCVDGEGLDEYWCPMDRNVVLTSSSGPDFVGVWMKIQHPWVTRMFGSTLTLTDSSVIQLEPRERK